MPEISTRPFSAEALPRSDSPGEKSNEKLRALTIGFILLFHQMLLSACSSQPQALPKLPEKAPVIKSEKPEQPKPAVDRSRVVSYKGIPTDEQIRKILENSPDRALPNTSENVTKLQNIFRLITELKELARKYNGSVKEIDDRNQRYIVDACYDCEGNFLTISRQGTSAQVTFHFSQNALTVGVVTIDENGHESNTGSVSLETAYVERTTDGAVEKTIIVASYPDAVLANLEKYIPLLKIAS